MKIVVVLWILVFITLMSFLNGVPFRMYFFYFLLYIPWKIDCTYHPLLMPTLIPSNSRSVLFYSPPLSTHSNEVFTYLALWINIRTKLLSLQFKRDVGRTFFGSIMRLPNTNDKYICTIDQSCIITFTLFHDVLFYTFHKN